MVAVVVLLQFLVRFLALQLTSCDGNLVYALDDAYIHMATAKNLALHGIWGITRYQFTSSESSILWPCLLAAGFRLGGVQNVLPLVLNSAAAVGLVVVGHVVFRREGVAPAAALVGLMALVLLPAIPVMVMMGMEHVLQCLLALLFAHLCVRRIVNPAGASRWALPLVGALMVSVRYEGLFLVGVAALLLLLTRNFRAALMTVVCAVVPVVVFGVISVSHGFQFLPNSLFVSTQPSDLGAAYVLRFRVAQRISQLLQPGPLSMAALLAMALAFVLRERRFASPSSLATVLALGTLILHVVLAKTGLHYGRYEAYLFVLTVYAIVLVLGTGDTREHSDASSSVLDLVRSPWVATGLALLIMCVPVFVPARDGYAVAPAAAANIYSQQYQMGRFVRQYYPDGHVALNDIGAVSFFSEAEVYDLWGLATNEVWKAKQAKEYDSDWIYEATRAEGVDIAIVHDHWFGQYGGLPDKWVRVGRWTIPENVICGGDTVSFYAVDPSMTPRLASSLLQFSDSLPDGVEESGNYVDGEKSLI